MQMTRSRLQLPPPRPPAALPPAGKVPAGGRLILWAPAEGDHNTPLLLHRQPRRSGDHPRLDPLERRPTSSGGSALLELRGGQMGL